MVKNIVLTGMMGSGKTTVGKLLSQRLRCPFIDTDAAIETLEDRSISDIFEQDGEAYFRSLERDLSQSLSQQSGLVIACGGGLPANAGAIELLKKDSLVFWLDRDPGETYDTLDLSHRPLAQSGRDDFIRRYQDRAQFYEYWSDHIVRARSPQEAVTLISAIYLEAIKP